MKNKCFLLISILISVLFFSCSLMPKFNTCIYIYNCEHGAIEVQLVSEQKKGNEFLLTAYPEYGYHLDINNLFIFSDINNEEYNSNIDDYYIDYYIDYDNKRLAPSETGKKNQFTFRAPKNANVTISAYFSK